MDLKSKAEKLLALHSGERILVLINAWDAMSARIVESAGSPAIASTSAGVANVLGYRDGERIPREVMMQAITTIVRAVDVPVTADAEAGYGQSIEDAAVTARAVIDAGAVGMNFEDSTGDGAEPLTAIDKQIERIRAIRRVAAEKGIPFVLNARTDVYLASVGAPESRFEETVRRANAYRDAGADCLFVPAVTDRDLIKRLVAAIRGPVNILATLGCPSVSELQELGVARVSAGSGLMRCVYSYAQGVADEIIAGGTWRQMHANAVSYVQMNAMLRER